jgi:hypothetical protein
LPHDSGDDTGTEEDAMPALAGTFVGTVTGDFGSNAPLRIQFSGPPEATVGAVSLGAGARIDCNGDREIDPVEFELSGAQTMVNPDGSSTYELTGHFEFDTDSPIGSVHVVVDVVAPGVLSGDSQSFTGPLDLVVRPSRGDDCTRHWTFSTTNRTSPVFWYNDQTGETQIWFVNEHQLVRRGTVLGEDGKPAFVHPPFRIVGAGSPRS